MLTSGSPAPEFALPGTGGDEIALYDSADVLGPGPTVVVFYPFDFHPPSTRALNRLGDQEWIAGKTEVDALGVSADSAYAHKAYLAEYGFPFPLVSDAAGAVADAFGVRSDEWSNHEAVPRRSAFAVDGEGTVRYASRPDGVLGSMDVTGLRDAVAGMDDGPRSLDADPGGGPGGGD